jgi:hypothetical protein
LSSQRSVEKDEPLGLFAKVSASNFSNQTVHAIKGALDCPNPALAYYCRALDRFLQAKAMPLSTNGVWAGLTFFAFADQRGKISVAGEGISHLYVRNQMASFNAVKPSNDSERKEHRAIMEGLKSGIPPRPRSELMEYLSTFSPRHTVPLESKASSLSFTVSDSADLPVKVFVRENPGEILVVEVWGEGKAVKIGVFPTGRLL